jgi:transposase
VIYVGVDAHKATHTMVAIDETGRKLGEKTCQPTPEGIWTP